MRRLHLLGLLFLLCPLFLSAEEWNPKPTNQLVNDYSNVLSVQQRQTLEQRLVVFDDSTSNQIVIMITPTLGGDEIMAVGTRVATAWGIGDKKHDNGVLILIKTKTDADPDGEVAILPGYGLEGTLPDAFCKRIIDDEMIESLSEGDYYEAICEALDVIEPVCRGEYSFQRYKQQENREAWIVVALFLLGMAGLTIWESRNGKDDEDGHSGSSKGSGKRLHIPTYWGTHTGSGSFGRGSGGFGGFGGGSFGGGGSHGKF